MKKFYIIISIFILLIAFCFYFLDLIAVPTNNTEVVCNDCNIVLITFPNLKSSHLGVYGYNRDTSLNIDSFAEDSIIFKNAFTASSWTTPAAASLLTSHYPYSHNVMRWYDEAVPLSSDIPFLPEILKNNGYVTASFNGGADYDKIYNFNRGFDHYFQGSHFSGYDELLDPAINWIKENRNDKFFLFLQSFDIHCPYYPPEPFRSRYVNSYINNDIGFNACFYSFFEQDPEIVDEKKFYEVYSSIPPRDVISVEKDDIGPANKHIKISEDDMDHLVDLYDGNVSYVDSLLEKLFGTLKELDLYKSTIVVFLSEHGELLGKNGRIMRGAIIRGNFYDDVASIPLIIKIPGMREKKEIDELVSIVDVVPTILDFIGVNFPDDIFQGKSLQSLIFEGKKINEYIFGGTEFFSSFKSNIEMVRSLEWKLIREMDNNSGDISYELYDLTNDAGEESNVYKDNPDLVNTLNKEIDNWINLVSIEGIKNKFKKISPELMDEIEMHGYKK